MNKKITLKQALIAHQEKYELSDADIAKLTGYDPLSPSFKAWRHGVMEPLLGKYKEKHRVLEQIKIPKGTFINDPDGFVYGYRGFSIEDAEKMRAEKGFRFPYCPPEYLPSVTMAHNLVKEHGQEAIPEIAEAMASETPDLEADFLSDLIKARIRGEKNYLIEKFGDAWRDHA